MVDSSRPAMMVVGCGVMAAGSEFCCTVVVPLRRRWVPPLTKYMKNAVANAHVMVGTTMEKQMIWNTRSLLALPGNGIDNPVPYEVASKPEE
ncbi:unnamed protein product [Camellia sinensis]